MTEVLAARELPHPVSFEVQYPERLSRLTTFFRLFMAIPQLFIVYLLMTAAYFITVIAWLSILFTGRYPKGFFDFTAGALRWGVNVAAYTALLRDEYPPFSWEPGEYPLALIIERAERQSRFRLFIRIFAIMPNYIVLYFVQVAWFFTTIVAWFAILITGRYPRGLFNFAVGVIRWSQRQLAYLLLLRDEYPPYSLKADARPGNEVVSVIIGVPLFALYIGLQFLPFVGLLGGGTDTVVVQAPLTSPAFAVERPSGEANGIQVTLLAYEDDVPRPRNALDFQGDRFVSFRVAAEKDGFLPTLFTPFFLRLHDCDGSGFSPIHVSSGFELKLFWRGGESEGSAIFQIPIGRQPCDLTYQAGLGKIEFLFSGTQ